MTTKLIPISSAKVDMADAVHREINRAWAIEAILQALCNQYGGDPDCDPHFAAALQIAFDHVERLQKILAGLEKVRSA